MIEIIEMSIPVLELMECSLREADGIHDIYLVPDSDFTVSEAKFFAGSPLELKGI